MYNKYLLHLFRKEEPIDGRESLRTDKALQFKNVYFNCSMYIAKPPSVGMFPLVITRLHTIIL